MLLRFWRPSASQVRCVVTSLVDACSELPHAATTPFLAATRSFAVAPAGSTSLPTDRAPDGRPFVGRDAQLAALDDALTAALAGHGNLVLLVGEPGIGKTRLSEEFTAHARARGALVLWGQCYEWDGAPPYWPWLQALRAWLQSDAPDVLRAALGRGAADIAQILPDVAEVVRDLPALPPMEPEQARFRLFDSVATALGNAARSQPLVVVLDDLHWADTPSLLLLQFLARAMREARLLVVGTYRNVEVGRQHPLAGALADLARQPGTQRIMLGGLPEADVRHVVRLAAGREPSSALVAAVFERTDGNPFFVEEVARLLASDDAIDRFNVLTWDRRVPESVREVTGRRLERLSAECNQVLAIAAVVGREFSLPILERVSGLDAGQLLDRLDEAVAAQVLQRQSGPGAYRFSHVLVQETIYAELSTATRVRLHGKVATALEQTFAANTDPILTDLARHCFQASLLGNADKAINYAIQAADQANMQFAWEEAVGHYERALQVIDLTDEPDEHRRCTLLLALAEAQFRSGEAARAAATGRQAAALARKIGAFGQLAEAIGGGTAFTGWTIGFSFDEARPLLEELLISLDPGDSALRVRLLGKLAVALYFFPDTIVRRRALSDEAVTIARRLGDPVALVSAHLSRRFALWDPGNVEERLADLTEAIRHAAAIGDIDLHFWAQFFCLVDLMELGDIVAADRALDTAARLAIESRAAHAQFWVMTFRAMRALLSGRFAEGEEFAEQALLIGQWAHPRETGASPERQYWRHLSTIRREQGQVEEIEELLDQVIAQMPSDSLRFFDVHRNWRCLITVLLCDTGRVVDARAEFERLAAVDFVDFRRDSMWLDSLTFLAEACAQLQDLPRATSLYALLEPYAGLNVVNQHGPICYGSASHYLGLLATLLTRWDDAERHFAVALAMNERMGARLYVVHTQHAWAEMLLRRGQPGDRQRALDLARAALSTAEERGMTRLASQAQALLDTVTEPAGVKSAATARGLSPREADVLRLLIEGRSDREIAAALFISHRTVMTHVANILNKLGVSSRTAAASLAVRDGLV